MDLRSYCRSKGAYDASLREPDLSKRPNSPEIDRVRTMAFEIAKEKIELRRSKI